MRKLRRRLLWGALITLVLLLAALALLAPTLADTAWARGLVAERMGAQLRRGVTLERIETGWFSGTTVRGVAIAGKDGEEPLLEVDAARLDASLLDLVRGAGPASLRVDGARLRVRQRPGGRTNLDDLLFPPARPGARTRAPAPPSPRRLDVRIENASLSYTFVPYRRPAPFDPFREDPVIRPALEGAVVVVLDRVDARLDGDAFEAKGTARYRGDAMELEASWDGATGRFAVSDAVLDWLGQAVDGDVSGRADVRATYADGAWSVHADATDVVVAVPGLPALNEKSVELRGGTRPRRLRVAATTFQANVVEADGALRATGELPLALATFWFGEPPADGRLFVDASVTGGRAKGEARVEELVFRDPALRAPPDTLKLDFDLARDGESRVVVASRDLDGAVRGTAGPHEGSLRGHFAGDLARAAPFLRLWRSDVDVAGRVDANDIAVDWGPDGTRVRGRAALRDVELAFEGRRYSRPRADVEVDLEADPDRVEVRALRVDDLRAQGTVRGLRDGPVQADGAVRGGVDLAPWPGRLELDVEARTRGDTVFLSGRATGSGLEEVGTVTANGTAKLRDGLWTGDVTARHEEGTVVLGGALWPVGRVDVRATAARRLAGIDDLVAAGAITRPDGRWTFRGTVSGLHERGALFVTGAARRVDAGWIVNAEEGGLGPVVLDAAQGTWRDAGGGELTLKAHGPLVETDGTGRLEATLALDGDAFSWRGALDFEGTRIGAGRLSGRGRGESIAVVQLTGPGLDLKGRGTTERLEVAGTLDANRFDERMRGTFDVEAEVGRERVRGTAEAAQAFFRDIEARGCAVRVSGATEAPDVTVAVRACSVDTVPVEGIAYRTADGRVTVDRVEFGSLHWTGIEGHADVRGRVLDVPDLKATLNGGTVTGSLRVDRSAGATRWATKLKGRGVQLDENLGRPLSFVVPVLRLRGERARRRLTGRTDFDLDLSARGVGGPALRASLSGNGRIELRDLAVRGSVLLPLLSLRVDQALLRRPMAFDDTAVRFRVGGGTLHTSPFRLRHDLFSLEAEGTVGLDGALDLLVKPTLPPVPLRVKGNLDDPKVRPAPLAGLFERK